MAKVKWLRAPEDHDFPAAASFLSLLMTGEQIQTLSTQWRTSSVVTFKAKDLLRAAQLDVLPKDNVHVASDLKKISARIALSPILLVRGDATRAVPLQIADGYHRVCASYLTDENTDIPCLVAG